ncbi:unnamed protein product [Dovyalis caffra]|uniref:Neprosin PEP catalytic domain-containing protein n=1 Tax=Dovyalis caffra TaxID=77055 RepID=A0AAV1S646_9ROSI|nr:unnamed protein product [Dovyalis caffra]
MSPRFVPQTDVSNATVNGLAVVSINVVLEVNCPSGSVPIRRITKEQKIRAKASFRKHVRGSYPVNDGGPEGIATAQKTATVYHGAAGFITISNPTAGPGQFSASVISIEAGPPEQFGVIRIGWMVNMDLYMDNRTRLYTIWGQVINGEIHGCYNTYCSGFVHTNPRIPLDMVLEPVSVIRGQQYYVKLAVTQDKSTGNWLLWYGENGEQVGYWPSKIFINLKDGADVLRWGGMVDSSTPQVPQMGNGDNGEIHSSKVMRVALTYESQPSLNGTVDVPIEVWKTKCYKSGDNSYKGEYWGYSFYFGGEGGDVSRCSN